MSKRFAYGNLYNPDIFVEKRHGPEVINFFSCSSQMSMNFFLLINIKMPTTVGAFKIHSQLG